MLSRAALALSLCSCLLGARPPVYRGLPSIDELCGAAGVAVTHLTVETEDGHQLWLHRLGNSSGPPVLLQHGLFNAAEIWINRPPDQALGFLLLKEGYDVYLGNQRGNAYGLRHRKYRRSDPRFWDWSFHESGYYDLPAMFDTILQLRKTKQLFYIGYSLGTTVFFVMGSTRPDYAKKVRAAVLLAPVAFLPHMSELKITYLRVAVFLREIMWEMLNKLTWVELMPRSEPLIATVHDTCGPNSPSIDFCFDLIGDLLGEHRENLDKETLAYLISFSPAGSSLKTVYHLGQNLVLNTFRMIDYGREKNLEVYGSEEPPDYDWSGLSCPVALFWGRNDKITSENSVKRIAAHLPNLITEKLVSDPLFTHADVIMGINSKEVLYNDVIKVLNKYK